MFPFSGCKDKEITKVVFVAKTQFLFKMSEFFKDKSFWSIAYAWNCQN